MGRLLSIFLLIIGLVGSSLAGGFSIYEFGAKASSMGGAFVAQANDASAVFYNPAGIAYLDGTQFYGGVTLIMPKSKWVGPTPIFSNKVFKTENQVFTPIGIYLTRRFSKKISAGFGITNPFGLGLKWSDDFPGRVLSKNVDLRAFYFSNIIAIQLTPSLSFGGGLDLVYSTVLLERSVLVSLDSPASDPGVEVGEAKLKGNSKLSYGFSAGLLFKSNPLSVGVMYRHQVKNKFENADATFKLKNDYYTKFLNGLGYFVNQKGSTEITYPNYLVVGAHYQLSERFGVEADYQWFRWSVFDELKLDFEKNALDQTIPEDYQDTYEIRVGAHFDLTENLTLRAGYIRDNTPQPIQSVSPLLPDNDRNDFSFGLGYRTGNMVFDLAYMLVTSPERSTIENGVGKNDLGFNGTYTSVANLFMFSWGISF